MNYLLIDGNNLIGKIPELKKLSLDDKKTVREKLVFKIDRYLSDKKYKCSIYFDGHPGPAINSGKSKIVYSFNKTADDVIKSAISNHTNPKLVTLVTSDRNLAEFGKVCSCKIISSSQFSANLTSMPKTDEETKRINEIDNEEMRRLFGA